MARAFVMLVTASFLVGCAAEAKRQVALPKPNFNGPVVLAPERPVDRTDPPPPMKSTSGAKPAVPSGWLPPVRPRAWKYVIVHHSATPTGGAAAFDRMHKAKGWDELGYDFVIGNGTDTPDGAVEVGPRWTKQKHGAHTKTADNRYNEVGIGICLVGDFDKTRPTPAQLASLAKLVAYLGDTYRIPTTPQTIIGHRDAKATDCPGNNVSLPQIRAMQAKLRQRPETVTAELPTGELMTAR